METKDGLTRDEAREAIKILTLRKDNLDIVTIGAGSIIAALLLAVITIMFANGNYQHLSNLSGLALNYLSEIFILLIVSLIYLVILLFKLCDINDRANKLAKKYNLGGFLRAISDTKFLYAISNKKINVCKWVNSVRKWVNEIIKT